MSAPSIYWEMPLVDLMRCSIAYQLCKTGLLNCAEGVELISGCLKMDEVGAVNAFPLAFLHVYESVRVEQAGRSYLMGGRASSGCVNSSYFYV